VESSDPGIRLAALTVLADIGGPATAGTFIEALVSQRSSPEISIATNRLESMEGETVDGLILDALRASSDETSRLALIRLIKNRKIAEAKEELIRQSQDPNPKVRIAAFQAMNPVVTADELTTLLALTKASEDKSVRDAAELAVYHACINTGNITEPAQVIFSELQKADRLQDQKSWITVLSLLGYDQALPSIFVMIKEGEPELAEFAVYQLRRWPNPAPMDDLFEVIEEKPGLSQRALAAIIELATAAADQQQMTEIELVACFQRAGQLAGSVQAKRGILSGLGRVQHIESVRASTPYLDDPEVEIEAAYAIVNACQSLSDANEYTAIENILDRISETDDDNLRRQITRLKRRRETWWTPLFNGTDLSGWEAIGQAEWSVQDGVLLGTQTTGTGGDLVTTNLYEDFELRFTYKVTWPANSGMWFRYDKDTKKGYQFDILKYVKPVAYSGTLYCPGKMFLTQNLDESLEKRDGWNEASIRAQGTHLTLTLNEHQVGECTDATHDTGRIGIQVHSGEEFKGMEIAFKRIEIRRLSVR
jgi:HEAT repeat protein